MAALTDDWHRCPFCEKLYIVYPAELFLSEWCDLLCLVMDRETKRGATPIVLSDPTEKCLEHPVIQAKIKMRGYNHGVESKKLHVGWGFESVFRIDRLTLPPKSALKR